MNKNWYALRSKARKEEILFRQVRARGYEIFYPQLRVNPVNPRSRKVRPYFPGYMFVHVDIDDIGLSTFQWMPFSLGLVTFGDEPAPVPENLIHSIRKKLEAIAAAGGEIFDGLSEGDEVRITDGPFAGYEAIFDTRLPGSERVRVLLQLLNSQRQVPVELNAGQIEREENRKRNSRRR